MTKLAIIWIGITSFIATLVIFLFGGLVFQACYSQQVTTISFHIDQLSPLLNCLLYTGVIVFLILFFCPVILTLCIYGIYVIIFNRPMYSSIYILWIFWFIFLYFVSFQMHLIPSI